MDQEVKKALLAGIESGRYKHSGYLWPLDAPLPLTPIDCVALVMGYMVRWDGKRADFLKLPGKYELVDGWLVLYQQ